MPNEPTNPSPQAVPGATTAPATSPAPTAFDQTEFESSLKQFGADWSLQNWKEKLSETRNTLASQGREYAELKKKHGEVQPFLEAIDKDPVFRDHVADAVRAYYSGGTPQPAYSSPSPQPSAYQQPTYFNTLDPDRRRISAVEDQLTTLRTDNELNALQGRGYPLDQAMRDLVHKTVLESQGSFNAEQVYMMHFGQKLIDYKAQEAVRAASESMRQNAGVYVPGNARSAPVSPGVDVTQMSDSEYKAHAKQVIESFRRG